MFSLSCICWCPSLNLLMTSRATLLAPTHSSVCYSSTASDNSYGCKAEICTFFHLDISSCLSECLWELCASMRLVTPGWFGESNQLSQGVYSSIRMLLLS